MTYQDLLNDLQKLTSDQLSQVANVFIDSQCEGFPIECVDISDEDFYWEDHGDLIGTIVQVKETFGDDWENELEDLIKVPSGSVQITAS